LEGLRTLAYNLQWDWDVDTVELFRRLDPDLWESSHYNPVLMLGMINQQSCRKWRTMRALSRS
jgi:starch phosphorylase